MGITGWTTLFVGLSFALYIAIAIATRVRSTEGFYVAGHDVPAFANGMATGADWMSAASFISMAGIIAFTGYAGSAYLLGWTGVRRVLALVAMDLGLLSYTASTRARRISVRARGGWRGVVVHGGRHLGPVLVTNAALALLLWAAGIGWTYLLWLAAYLTTFSLFVRIRAMAEHACTAMDPNPFLHTRTTHAGILARLTVAPHHVNYHLEHHLLMTVPHQSLPRMHRMLQARQAIPATSLAGGYMEVLRRVTGRAGDLAHVSEGR